MQTLRDDIATAEKLQKAILPIPNSTSFPFHWAVNYAPLAPIGGDIYDIREIKENQYRFFIADAAGHGTQAALLTMAIKAEYESIEHTDVESPASALTILNEKTFPLFRTLETLFTAFVLDIDVTNRKIQFSTGGHPDQILITKGEVQKLYTKGPILGLKKNAEYLQQEIVLEENSRVFLFTDGAYELFNEKTNETYSEEEFYKYLFDSRNLSLEQIVVSHLQNLKNFKLHAEIDDDFTLIGIEV